MSMPSSTKRTQCLADWQTHSLEHSRVVTNQVQCSRTPACREGQVGHLLAVPNLAGQGRLAALFAVFPGRVKGPTRAGPRYTPRGGSTGSCNRAKWELGTWKSTAKVHTPQHHAISALNLALKPLSFHQFHHSTRSNRVPLGPKKA